MQDQPDATIVTFPRPSTGNEGVATIAVSQLQAINKTLDQALEQLHALPYAIHRELQHGEYDQTGDPISHADRLIDRVEYAAVLLALTLEALEDASPQ